MGNYEQEKRPGKNLIFPAIVVLLILLPVLLYVGYVWNLRRQVAGRLNAIRAAGYPVTLQELDAWYVEPPGENAADYYLEAVQRISGVTDEQRETLPILGKAKLPPLGQPLAKEMKTAIAKYLADNEGALAVLHEAAAVKECRYPVDLTMGPAALLPYLYELRKCCRLLALEALMCAEEGKLDMAITSTADCFAMGRSLANEPLLISQLVRYACNVIALGSLERLLSRAPLAEGELSVLAAALAEAEAPRGIIRAFAAERCVGSSLFQMSGNGLRNMVGGSSWFSGLFVLVYGIPAVRDRDHLVYLERMDEFVAGSQQPLPERLKTAAQAESKMEEVPRSCLITRCILPALWGAVGADAISIALVRAARAALAVERYRLAAGKLPEGLSELVPTYMDSVPSDPFDGKPLRYRTLAKGYVVYSVGEDGKDDGGETDFSGKLQRDPGTDIVFTVAR